jgi:hypothetical protein
VKKFSHDSEADMFEKVLSNFIFWERAIIGLGVSILCVLLIGEIIAPGALEPSAGFSVALLFFTCGLGVIKFRKPARQINPVSIELPGSLYYEHSTGWKRKSNKFGGVLSDLFSLLFWVFGLRGIWLLSHGSPNSWLMAGSWALLVLVGVFWALRVCRSLYVFCVYEPKTKVTLFKRKLNVSHPQKNLLSGDTVFPIDKIANASIITGDNPKIRGYLFEEEAATHTRFFLSDYFPLPAGHQAVDLKLRNGRHVLIETDDADNFLAALKRCGVGG